MDTLNNTYPTINIQLIQNPNRLFAIPILGILIKFIILIPIFIELMFLGLAAGLLTTINSFSVLFTGHYWDLAYQLNLGIIRFTAKVNFYLYGLTDKYPGFSLSINDDYSVDISKPESPNRLFAIPILGFLIRAILLIPFFIWVSVVQTGSRIGVFLLAWVKVLFTGKYPESIFELATDEMRLTLSISAYFAGLSDKYPNFAISMNHKVIKIILLIIGVLSLLSNLVSSASNSSR